MKKDLDVLGKMMCYISTLSWRTVSKVTTVQVQNSTLRYTKTSLFCQKKKADKTTFTNEANSF